jgi:hypothetical protein
MSTTEVLKTALETLDGGHLDPLRQTVLRILSTQRAEYVFAQVADGLPTNEAAKYKSHDMEERIENRLQASSHAFELVRDWRSEFNLLSLEVDARVSILN